MVLTTPTAPNDLEKWIALLPREMLENIVYNVSGAQYYLIQDIMGKPIGVIVTTADKQLLQSLVRMLQHLYGSVALVSLCRELNGRGYYATQKEVQGITLMSVS